MNESRIVRYKRKIALFIINHFLKGTRVIFFPLKRSLLNWAKIEVGENSKIVGPLYVSCELSIGSNVWLGRNFSADGNGKVEIGNNCDVAPNVQMYTGSHQIGDHDRRAGSGFNGTITVGNGCWLCAASKVLPNVSIGSGALIAAGSVVTSYVEDDCFVGGVPAKIIKKINA